MQYVIDDLIGQLIYTLKADSAFSSMTVDRHSGEVNILLFTNPAYWEGMLRVAPFVLVKYNGKIGTPVSAIKKVWMHELEFSAYVATKNLGDKNTAAKEAEALLAKIFDLWHGRAFYSTKTLDTNIPLLGGVQITTSGFNQQRVLLEAGGQDERLVMALPEIILYETKYNARLLVS